MLCDSFSWIPSIDPGLDGSVILRSSHLKVPANIDMLHPEPAHHVNAIQGSCPVNDRCGKVKIPVDPTRDVLFRSLSNKSAKMEFAALAASKQYVAREIKISGRRRW